MKALVLARNYPELNGSRQLYYVHSRNINYVKAGMNVTVINFGIKKGYYIDGIRVISLSEFTKEEESYDILILHAANLKHHYRFLLLYGNKFKKKMFVYHGHEILHYYDYYPKPYDYVSKFYGTKRVLRNLYDDVKLIVWNKYIKKHANDIRLIFVSEWLYKVFLNETRLQESDLCNNAVIIPNSIGMFFEENNYSPSNIKYDYISIRGMLDGSKYCADIVTELAEKYPDKKFCLIGRGEFFKHYRKPDNLDWIDKVLTHEEVAQYVNSSKVALMPTKQDTHGLMACELAAFGIPVITSDIPICREVFSDCPTAYFIDNNNPVLDEIDKYTNCAVDTGYRWNRFYSQNTIQKEIEYIYDFVK